MSFCVDFSFCTNCRLAFNHFYFLNFVLYVSLFKSFHVQLFFIFKLFYVKVSSHVRYRFMSNVILIKYCTSYVVPFLFIYVKCHVILINCALC